MFEQSLQSGSVLPSLLELCKPSYLFRANDKAGHFGNVLWWWESRRAHYNAIMLLMGVASWWLYWHLFDLYAPDPADDGMFPGLMVIVFGVAANVCYCAGWVLEGLLLLVRRRAMPNVGRVFLAVGLAFSLFLVAVPSINALRLTHAMHVSHANHWVFD